MQLNEIFFAGFVGKDAELFVTQSGMKIVSFSLCQTTKGKDGRADTSTWVRVKVFGAWCETAVDVKKGNNVFVKGILNVSEYDAKDGTKKTMVEVIANSIAVIKMDAKTGQAAQGIAAFTPANDPTFDMTEIPF